jgi:hypothetical protein
LNAYAQGMKPLLRLLNTSSGRRFYTIFESERDGAISLGYRLEGIECYVWDQQVAGTVPLFRLSKPNGDYLYTTSVAERDEAVAHDGYTFNQNACYVKPQT